MLPNNPLIGKKETITLQRKDGQWVATFSPGKRTRELFGTDTIPTAFFDTVEAKRVMETVQSRNPHAIVQLAAEGFRFSSTCR